MASLTEPTTNGHHATDNAIPTVEYSEAVERQTTVDAELAAVHFTGVTQDGVTGDWICWASGRIIGWAKTPGDAGQRVTNCQAAHEAHPQPTATVSTARDENPCSVELQCAKDGVRYWTAKSYHPFGDEDAAIARLAHVDAELARKYRPELAPAS